MSTEETTGERGPEERLLWLLLACFAWSYSTLLPKVTAGIALASIAGFAVGLVALVLAAVPRRTAWTSDYVMFGLFTFFVVEFGVIDAIVRARDPYLFSTDAHVYMDYAARLLASGRNPYAHSLYGAIVAHRVPIELQTPLADGGLTDRVAYPSLSFVALVPFVWSGIPTRYAFALAFYAALAVVFWTAPKKLRPLVLLPFFADHTFLGFSFGGVTDSVWALFLCLAVVFWKRPYVRAVLFGLACAYKQHPWLLFPFLAGRIALEAEPGTVRSRAIAVARFAGVAALVFLAFNLPFFLWKPSAYRHGVLEPLVTRMVPMGEGISAIVPFLGLGIPRAAFGLAFWGSMAVLLVVTLSWSGGRRLVWIAPSLAFFFNYRSLSSYWYLNVLPFAVELARELPPARLPTRWLKPALAVGGAILFGAAVAGVIGVRGADAKLEVEVRLPVRTWDAFAHRLDVRVRNRSGKKMYPRFWIQGDGFQPLPWHIDVGPHELAPGEEGAYSLSALHRITEFSIDRGARLTVTDLSSDLRKMVEIEGDRASLSMSAIANARFRFWDVRLGTPMHWSLSQSKSAGAHVRPSHAGGRRTLRFYASPDPRASDRDALHFCIAVASCWSSLGATRFTADDLVSEGDQMVSLGTSLADRTRPVSLWAKTPSDANVAPDYPNRYGVLVTFQDRVVFVMLGGDAAEGKLADGTPYVVLPGPRDAWTRYTIDMSSLREKYAPFAYAASKATPHRFIMLDIPVVPTRIALTLVRASRTEATADFGEFEEDLPGHDSPVDVIAQLDRHPGQIDVWRSSYELELGNLGRARDYIEAAQLKEAHPYVLLRAGDVARQLGRLDEAKLAYERAKADSPIDAGLGLGWTAIAEKEPARALVEFEAAKKLAEEAAAERRLAGGRGELPRLNAVVGCALSHALLGDCAAARKALDELPADERELQRARIPELLACEP